ncbi:MAG: hypothetical protein WAM82_18225 [Thermoanaerobaculia bacterium]
MDQGVQKLQCGGQVVRLSIQAGAQKERRGEIVLAVQRAGLAV